MKYKKIKSIMIVIAIWSIYSLITALYVRTIEINIKKQTNEYHLEITKQGMMDEMKSSKRAIYTIRIIALVASMNIGVMGGVLIYVLYIQNQSKKRLEEVTFINPTAGSPNWNTFQLERTSVEEEIEKDMELALINQEFKVYLQPKYSLDTEQIVGAEALVRWIHSTKGIIPPDKFIPLFEKNGFIKQLDFYIFEEVCSVQKKWGENNIALEDIPISVNLSRIHMNESRLTLKLGEIIKQYGIEAKCLEIELTESAILDNIDSLIRIIEDIKKAGFAVSMDDFGSGYSSLNLLKDLLVDILKIDKEFLGEGGDDYRGKVILSNIIHMAKELKLITVAEGVETKEQVEFLKEVGCNIAQGYYYAKPMPISDFEKLMFGKVID